MQVRQIFLAWLRQYGTRLQMESWQTPGAAERRVKLMNSCNPRRACCQMLREPLLLMRKCPGCCRAGEAGTLPTAGFL